MCANALHRLFWLFKEGVFIPYISDVIDINDLRPDSFNLVSAGSGTGKTYWVINNLANELPGVMPCEIAFVTSRAIAKEQQARSKGTTKLRRDDIDILSFWNDDTRDKEEALLDYGVLLMTYDQMINACMSKSPESKEVLRNLKVAVFDVCHTLFSDLFINDFSQLHMWIREVIYAKNRKLLIGLSATAGIIEQNSSEWGVPINHINQEVIAGHLASMVIDKRAWLLVIPRSGLGCKFRMQLDNTVGDIDGDHWESDNEGHIVAKVMNDGKEGKYILVGAGEAFVQGIILPYKLTHNDRVTHNAMAAAGERTASKRGYGR